MIKPIGLVGFATPAKVQSFKKVNANLNSTQNTEFNSKNYSSAVKSQAMAQIAFTGAPDIVRDRGQFEDVKIKARAAVAKSEKTYKAMDEKINQVQKDVDLLIALAQHHPDNDSIEYTDCTPDGTNEGKIDFIRDDYGRVVLIEESKDGKVTSRLELAQTDNILSDELVPKTYTEFYPNGSKNIAVFNKGSLREYNHDFLSGKDFAVCSHIARVYDGKIASINAFVVQAKKGDEEIILSSFSAFYNKDGSTSRFISRIRTSNKNENAKTEEAMFNFDDNGRLTQYTKDTTYKRDGAVNVGLSNTFRKNGYVSICENSFY